MVKISQIKKQAENLNRHIHTQKNGIRLLPHTIQKSIQNRMIDRSVKLKIFEENLSVNLCNLGLWKVLVTQLCPALL